VVYQDLTRIDKSIRDGDFVKNQVLVDAMDRRQGRQHALHLIGLVSPNGIHSHDQHLYALIRMAASRGVPHVFVHAFTDGRDTSPTGGARFVGELERVMKDARVGQVARWRAVLRNGSRQAMGANKEGYDAIVGAPSPHTRSAVEFIQRSYEAGVTDEFIVPGTIVDANDRRLDRFATATVVSSLTIVPIARDR
jgi:2,3-bisphosphoglycerate-independent phosphoglycerate mutase